MSSYELNSNEDNLSSFDILDIDNDESNLLLEPWLNLIQYLKIEHLDNLRAMFKNDDFTDKLITKEEFVKAIDSVIGNSKYSLQAISLFNEITKSETDTVTWNMFLDFYIQNAIIKEFADIRLTEPNILPIAHVQKEPIFKIVPIETETSFAYAVISKFGRVGLYTGDLVILTTYKVIFTRCDNLFKEKYMRKRTMWITDAIFLANVCYFVVANTARSIIFYDASKQNHIPLWLIEGIPNAIYTMEYYSNNLNTYQLFLGDDSGSILILNFMQGNENFFRRKHNDKLSYYFWRELQNETSYVVIKKIKNFHRNCILSLKYNPETFILVSTSRDFKNSIVIFNLKEKKKKYSFQSKQGISSFSMSYDLHLMLTGTDSGIVQLWNLYVTAKPITKFSGHKCAIIDVQILSYRNSALTLSRDGVLKVWNLKTHECVQTINIQFPCFGIYGKFIEWGKLSIYPGPKYSVDEYDNNIGNSIKPEDASFDMRNKYDPWKRLSILISCCNYIAKINIINGYQLLNFENKILSPPPIQNDIIIPDDWKLESDDETFENVEESTNIDLKAEYHPILKSIMEHDFLTSLRIPKYDINRKIAQMEIKKMEMIKPVLQCAPFIALDLHEVEEIKVSGNLPVPRNKEMQKISDRIQRLLSAVSERSEMLSDRSSKSKSSRSSIVEF